MSNVNNYAFANKLQAFKERVLDPQIKKTEDAKKILEDPNHKWENEDQKKRGKAQYDVYAAWLTFYQAHYNEGIKLCVQHENLVNKMSNIYDNWFQNISNEGRQETELMSSQADMLQGLFVELYEELKPLGLNLPMPQALNMK